MRIFVFVFFCLSLPVQASSFRSFYQGLKSAFYLKDISRGLDVSDKVRLTKFSRIGRILSPDAIATYNDKTNVISLDEAILTKVNRQYHALDAREILGAGYSSYYKVSTVFHELGHAEMDIFVENERELTDLSLKHFYKTELRPLYRKYFKFINPWVVFHEHFGYYRSELIEIISLDVMDLQLENGWAADSGRCYLTAQLKKKLADGASREEFLELQTHRINDYQKISPSYLFVKGKEVDLSKIAGSDQLVIQKAHALFWAYHQEFYGFPRSLAEVVKSANEDSRYDKLKECRQSFYDRLF